MRIESGLFDHQVLQRRGRGGSDQPVEGASPAAGRVLATVRRGRRPIPGWTARAVGRSRRGRFTARLRGLPPGGPYRIELRIGADVAVADDVLVGDVWLLGGQSNMQGIGLIADASRPRRDVRCHYADDGWGMAVEPLHRLWEAVDPVHGQLVGGGRGNPHTGAGPGLPFALRMRRLTGVPQGLIACAHGGTSMAQWDPGLAGNGGSSLYGAMLRRLSRDGGSCAGLVWYQGENDASVAIHAGYGQTMAAWIAAVRRDTGMPRLPVVIAQLGRTVSAADPEPWNSVQEQQRKLPRQVGRLAVVPTIDLGLDDPIHIAGRSQPELGRRFADAMHALRGGRMPASGSGRQIEFRDASVVDVLGNGFLSVRIRFRHVLGRLVSDGPAWGFSLATPGRSDGTGVSRTELDRDTALVHTTRTALTMPGSRLWYGHGSDPACTVHDEAGRSLPVFGPILVAPFLPLSPFLDTFEISAFQPACADLARLEPPEPGVGMDWTARTAGRGFTSLRDDIVRHGPRDAVVWLRARMRLAEAMRLRFRFGYDGPVRLWLDRKLMHHDPAGTNPAVADAHTLADAGLDAGDHEVLIALGTNHGRAWGVWLRAERLGLAPGADCANIPLPSWMPSSQQEHT